MRLVIRLMSLLRKWLEGPMQEPEQTEYYAEKNDIQPTMRWRVRQFGDE